MSSAQVGKTELLLNSIGYFVDYDPAPILLLQPTLEMAQTFSKDRLAPMCRDTPALRGKIQDAKSRSSGNTMLHKTFPGGHITMAGANSPASLASRPIRILLADEVDRYPASAGAEGDPVNLAKKRTTTFWNKKIILVSTPTVKGASRIETAYEDSTMEQYQLPCPECGEYQPLQWRNIVFDEVGHACEHCGVVSNQILWTAKPGKWVARKHHHKCRGFHLNELVSPWRRWEQIIDDFKEAKKSPETLKTFVNTSLGETWEDEGEKVDTDALYARREHYPAEVPAGALIVTAAVDTQDDRLEIQYEAWGEGMENWKIAFDVLRGDLNRPEIWKRLDAALARTFTHETGATLNVSGTTIDTGGHYTQQVYSYVKQRGFGVFAIKGATSPEAPLVGRPSKNNLGKVNLFTVGVHKLKQQVMQRACILEPGAGYTHFPISEEFDQEWFAQFTAEELRTKYVKGYRKQEWHKIRPRNEALDLSGYNLACLLILNPSFDQLKKELDRKLYKPEPDKPKPPPTSSGGWLNSGGDSWL